jgi:PAS domain-containing protein
LRNLARDFVERTRFERLVATDPAGVPLFASTATVGAIGESLVQRAVDRAAPAYGLIGGDGTAVRLRTALPVVRPQQDAAPETVVGAVLLDVPVRAVVSRATGLPDLATGTETIDLLVRRPDGPRVLHADGLSAWGIEGATPAPDLAFTRARRGDRAVFVAAQAVAGPPWTVAVSTPVASALASHRTFTRAAIGVALGLGLAVVGGLAGGWYRLSASHARERAARERAFAERIERDRRLLDQITSSVPELIGLKAPDGGYRYVNTALAAWAARPAEELVGADDGAIFGPTLADRLGGLASDARTRDGAASALLPVYRGGDRRHVRFTVKPLDDGDPEASQQLMVGTDLTDLVRAEENRRADLGRTVTALARAVEMVDPYLAGHSRRLQRLAEAVGRQLRLSEDRITTISLAAQLSQVGKLGVRRELLVSAERHGEAEIQEMRRHIEYADRILGEINFQLPVRNAVIQMHERLDGTGYPAGLSGDEIAQEARVLGAVDVFCARIEPRSYRPAIDSDTALDVLQAHPERYDAEVVDALARVLASPEGEKAIAGLDA